MATVATITSLAGCAGHEVLVCTDTRVDIENRRVFSYHRLQIIRKSLSFQLEFKNSAAKNMQSAMRNSLETQIDETGADLVDRKLPIK
ncbi:hypothetical protein O9993_11175 [Vibrio lentus]|nr:hypothetical protein [Vibrio lentus]